MTKQPTAMKNQSQRPGLPARQGLASAGSSASDVVVGIVASDGSRGMK